MRVFLDSNVILSAFATRGLCNDVLELVFNQHELITAEVVLEEVRRVAAKKFKTSPQRIERLVSMITLYHVEPHPQTLPLISIRDRTDLPVLASALAASADILVTGDKDLLELKEQVSGLVILDPREFFTQYHTDE